MEKQNKSRRNFLKESGSVAGGSWLGMNMPLVLALGQAACARRDAGEAWQNLTSEEATGFAAIADQIIPPDETPGGAEIGVVHFLDEALNDFMTQAAPMLKSGLAELDASARENHPGADRFSDLPFGDQTALLKEHENTPLFQTMMVITRIGVFALPGYGGNKDHAGWALIGFEHRHAWQPPFGYYDEVHASGEGGHVES